MSSVSLLLNRQCGKNGKAKKNKCGCVVENLLELAEDKAATYRLEEMPCNLPSSVRSTFLITFSPDGLKVAAACGDHHVWVCDVRTGKLLKTLKGHPRTPWCLAFHPTSNDILASGCLGGEVRVWDLLGSSEVWVVEQKQPITSLAFHPTDKVLVIATLNQLHFWDWSLPTPFATCETNSDKEKVRYVKFDTNGTRLITGITNVPPESQRSHVAESLYGSANFPRTASSRSFSAQRTSILNRLMNLYSHLEGLEEISRYTGSGTSTSNRSGAMSPTQDDALQRARLFAEEVSIHNAHLYRQRLYNLDQALGLQSEPADLLDESTGNPPRMSSSRSTFGPGLTNPPWSRSPESSLPSLDRTTSFINTRERSTTGVEPDIMAPTSSNPQDPQIPVNTSSQGSGSVASGNRTNFFGYGSVNADFWVTFSRLRFICSSLERRIHQQPPPSPFLDMPPEAFAPNISSTDSLNQRSVLDPLFGPASFTSGPSTSQPSSSIPQSSQSPPRNSSGSSNTTDSSREGPSTPDVSVSLVSLLTRLQHSLQSLSNAALTTAVARDQIQQVRTRIAEILERLDNVSGYRARLTNLRDQIYEAADRMAQRGEDNTQTQRRDLAYCLWLVEMSLQLTRDMQRILATDYRLTQLHLNSSMPNAPLSTTTSGNSATTTTSSESASTLNPLDPNYNPPSTSSGSRNVNLDLLKSSILHRYKKQQEARKKASNCQASGSANSTNSTPSTSSRINNFNNGQDLAELTANRNSAVRCSISERINSLLYLPPTSSASTSSENRAQSDSAFETLPSFPLGSSSHNLADLASERLPNHFNTNRNSPGDDTTPFYSDSSPFFWRNLGLRRTDSAEPSSGVRIPTVPTLSSTVGLLFDSAPQHPLNDFHNYHLSSSRSSPFEPPSRRINLNVNSEHPPMNDASTSTNRTVTRASIQGTSSTTSQPRSSSRSCTSCERPPISLGRGISSRIITSAVRPTRTAIARRRWPNYRMNMSPSFVRRRRLYRWSSQQPLASSGGTQLVVNPRQSRQNYSDTSEGSHNQLSPRSVNRSSATSESAHNNINTRIRRRIRNPSSPSSSSSASGQSEVLQSEIIMDRLRTVHRERLGHPFMIPYVQIEPSSSSPDGELPPLPPEQRPRSPPLAAILARAGVVSSASSLLSNGGSSAINNYLSVSSPRLGPVPSHWSHFYDTGIRPRGLGGGFDSPHNLTYRIQCWDFSSYIIPNISQSESCIVVPKCKISNDGSIDISKDGKYLAAFVPNIGNMRQSTMVAVYSLAQQSIGQCLYTWNFENTNAVSVSFSPLARYLVIGIGTHRHHLGGSEREPLAQIFRLDPYTKNSSLTFVSSVYQECSNSGTRGLGGIAGLGGAPGLNFVRWLPESGQGLIYGTNRGSLLICRPVSSNSDSHYVSPYHLVSTSTQTIDQESNATQPEMQSTATQTASSVPTNDSDDDDDDDDDE